MLLTISRYVFILFLTMCLGCASLPINKSVKTRIKKNFLCCKCILFIAPENINDVTCKDKRFYWSATINKELKASMPHSFSFASATPLTKDGYYLTAYHCIDQVRKGEKIWIAVFNSDNPEKLKWDSVKIIWEFPNADIALLHSDIQILHPRAFSKTGKILKKGTVVAQCGIRSGCEFGRTTENVLLDQTSESAVTIRHNARSRMGDSGGPLLNDQGELLGIVTEKALPFLDSLGLSSAIAVRPNPETIKRLIKEDRIQRKTEQNGLCGTANLPRTLKLK